jgi:hypothetical protein
MRLRDAQSTVVTKLDEALVLDSEPKLFVELALTIGVHVGSVKPRKQGFETILV